MKKGNLIILTVAIILLVLGIFAVAASAAMNGFKSASMIGGGIMTNEYVKKDVVLDISDTANISSDLTVLGIKVIPSDDEKVHITYYESEYQKIQITQSQDKLTIESIHKASIFFSFDLSFVDKKVTLSIPRNHMGNLDLRSTTGSISISGLNRIGDISAETTTGSVKLEKINASDISITAATGSATLSDVSSKNNINLSSSTGSQKTDDVFAEKTIKCVSTTGTKNIEETKANEIVLRSSTGSINIDGVDAQIIDLHATTGSIRGELEGNRNEYAISAHTSTGSCNLPYEYNGAPRKLKASTTTGSINITFDD